jgi:uncharacterized protein involved in exopolysaccharide biosynthesis
MQPQMRGGIWTPPDVMRLLAVLAQNLGWLALSAAAGLLATIGWLLITSPTYEIGAQVMVRVGTEMAAPATVSASGTRQIIPMSMRIEDITAEVQIMKDPALVRETVASLGEDFFFGEDPAVTLLQRLKKLVKDAVSDTKEAVRNALVKVGLLPELAPLDRVVLLLQTVLSIEPVTRSDVIELTLLYPDPGAGEAVLRRFLDIYLAKRRDIFLDGRVSDFFAAEVASVDARLLAAEDDLAAFLRDNQAWQIASQIDLAVAGRAALRQDLDAARTTLAVEEERLRQIEADIAGQEAFEPASSSTRRNQVRDELRLKLVELQLEVDAETARSGPRSQQVQSLTDQIARLREIIAAEPERIDDSTVQAANPLLQSLRARQTETRTTLATTLARIDTLTARIAEVEADLERMQRMAALLARKQQDLDRLRVERQAYRQALEEARVAAAVSEARLSNVVVFAEPQGGVAPAKPRLSRTVMIGLVLSLMAASGVILIVDALRPRVRDNADLARLAGPQVMVRAVADARRG